MKLYDKYGAYKADWLRAHTTFDERMEKFVEWAELRQRKGLEQGFSEWLMDNNGFNGACYASFEEWKNNEEEEND